jgi:threonine dehydrogenase-like Zn-dependent dehydrogenase
MSNGVQWALIDGDVKYGTTVLIQGPGQQGLCCVMAAKHAGADCIIITGTARDARRLEVAKVLGADYTIDVDREDPLARIMDITNARGVDIVIDCASGGTAPVLLGLEAMKRRGGTMIVQAEGNQQFPNFPIGRMTRKGITLKSARGHSYRSVELGLQMLATHKFPIDLITTHRFGLSEVDYAIKSVGGQGAADAIHVSVMPWR